MKLNKLVIALMLNAALFNFAHATSSALVLGYGMDLNAPVGGSATHISGTPGDTTAVVDLPSFVAPLGIPGPALYYPATYSGYASANDRTGTLKAYVKAVGYGAVPWRNVKATASDEGSYTFTGNDKHSVALRYDGWFSSLALSGIPTFAELSLTACSVVADSFSGCKTDSVNLNSDLTGQIASGKLSLMLTGQSGDRFQIWSSLSVTAWANAPFVSGNTFAEAAFNHTAQLDFVLPVGASIQGDNGFLSAVPVSFAAAVPEPESYAMMLAGLGLIGAAVARRKAE